MFLKFLWNLQPVCPWNVWNGETEYEVCSKKSNFCNSTSASAQNMFQQVALARDNFWKRYHLTCRASIVSFQTTAVTVNACTNRPLIRYLTKLEDQHISIKFCFKLLNIYRDIWNGSEAFGGNYGQNQNLAVYKAGVCWLWNQLMMRI